ncbi:MAG: DNA polymerase III subunit beta [Ignavibacteriales bacterium]|nr:DNA polymerase III subunit beta [Ignavibacteriales bacterium]
MKFTVGSLDLQRVLTKVSGVVPTKSTLPILENILFSLSKNTLKLAATDLEVSVTATLEVKGTEDGTVAVPAKRMMDTIRALPEVQIIFHAETSSQKIKMITDSGEYGLVGESSEEFPAIPQFKAEDEIVLDGKTLSAMIGRTLFSVSTDELRPAMTGVLFQIKGGDMRVVATDGHRLVRINYSNLTPARIKKDIIVPAKALHLVSRSVQEGNNTISVDNTHVQFSFGSTTLISRLIQENYPNYESVIPLDNDKKLTISRDLLLASVRRVSLYSSSTTHQVRLTVKKNELRAAAEDVDFGGEAKEKIPCQYDGDEMEIGFNSTYLIDILSHAESEDVVFKLSTPVRAAIITPHVSSEGEEVLMLVMPMRLNN